MTLYCVLLCSCTVLMGWCEPCDRSSYLLVCFHCQLLGEYACVLTEHYAMQCECVYVFPWLSVCKSVVWKSAHMCWDRIARCVFTLDVWQTRWFHKTMQAVPVWWVIFGTNIAINHISVYSKSKYICTIQYNVINTATLPKVSSFHSNLFLWYVFKKWF